MCHVSTSVSELPVANGQRRLTQVELIELYRRVEWEGRHPGYGVIEAHCEHILLGLRKLIESRGPTSEYYEWLNSVSPT